MRPIGVLRNSRQRATRTPNGSVFARPQPEGLSFAAIDFSRYANLAAAIAEASSGALQAPEDVPDLFERTLRSVLSGLLGR
jgi:hypothetical protein